MIRNAEADWSNLSKRNQSYMAFLGIDRHMAGRIRDQLARFGDDIEGTKVANTKTWDDVGAGRACRAALTKDVDSVIVTSGAADKPLLAHTPVGGVPGLRPSLAGSGPGGHDGTSVPGVRHDAQRGLRPLPT